MLIKPKLKTRITLALLMVEKGGEGKEEDIYIYIVVMCIAT